MSGEAGEGPGTVSAEVARKALRAVKSSVLPPISRQVGGP